MSAGQGYKAQLDAILKQRGIGSSSSIPFSMPSFEGTSSTSWLKIGGYTLGITLIVLLVLTVVHFTIRPIFRLKSGTDGIITIPGISTADDGAIYWKSLPHSATLDERETIFEGSTATTQNYSLAVDFFFIDLNAGTSSEQDQQAPRPLLLRYNPSLNTTLYSLGMFLDARVNDLEVRVRTTTNDLMTVVLKNVPAKTPIRVGVCIYPTHFEVYRNGLLVGTRRLSAAPIANIGRFWCDPGKNAETDAVLNANTCTSSGPGGEGILGYGINMHLWLRTLHSKEMQFSTPNMPTASDFIPGANKSIFSGYIDTRRDELMATLKGEEGAVGQQIATLQNETQELAR
jgi:hypothetical protein